MSWGQDKRLTPLAFPALRMMFLNSCVHCPPEVETGWVYGLVNVGLVV